MSRHLFDTTQSGLDVQVAMGWDRPLQRYFLTVTDGADGFLYCNLDEPDPDHLSIHDIRAALGRLQVEVPEAMFEALVADRAANTGNRTLHYRADGGLAPAPGGSHHTSS